jgi:hypothetical protein
MFVGYLKLVNERFLLHPSQFITVLIILVLDATVFELVTVVKQLVIGYTQTRVKKFTHKRDLYVFQYPTMRHR